MQRVPYPDLYDALRRGMEHLGFRGERAELCARLFAETTRDGVYTHGLNRFPRFSTMVRNGSVDVNAQADHVAGSAALERWDGHRGCGNLNAYAAMTRTITLARQYGLGAVALGNTNHWMRGGSYGWMAAEAGLFAICWSNTLANLPAWGAKSPTLGNNPLIFAVPRSDANGAHVVLDMAMSQFSYGSLAGYSARKQPLPVPGGYDVDGNLTTDAGAIEASQRALAIGYWKGSGLSMLLDMFAAMLSGGLATHDLNLDPYREFDISQFFLAIDPSSFAARPDLDRIANGILDSLKVATPIDPAKPVRYPGEQTLQLREENMRLGVPVDFEVWTKLKALDF
jgi:3-dehydro-L-gulonate 2-dehydrogenase